MKKCNILQKKLLLLLVKATKIRVKLTLITTFKYDWPIL